jgi:hypothetical protein
MNMNTWMPFKEATLDGCNPEVKTNYLLVLWAKVEKAVDGAEIVYFIACISFME